LNSVRILEIEPSYKLDNYKSVNVMNKKPSKFSTVVLFEKTADDLQAQIKFDSDTLD